MSNFYVAIDTIGDWERLHPKKHWKDKCSAKELATCWQAADGFPSEVEDAFAKSKIPTFQNLQFVAGFPEHKIQIPPRQRRPSQTDLMVIARSDHQLVTIAVEGKAEEPFGELVGEWRQTDTDGKPERLAFLSALLGLSERDLDGARYQLLHRTASALLAARTFAARHAVTLIHSFSAGRTSFPDYAKFLELFRVKAEAGVVQRAAALDGIEIYFGWASR